MPDLTQIPNAPDGPGDGRRPDSGFWKMPIEEIAVQCREAVTNLGSCYETLRAIVARHEPTIQRRWMKKNERQRLKILQTACPTMAKRHRPAIHACTSEIDKVLAHLKDPERTLTRSKIKRIVMGGNVRLGLTLPMLNQEDLLQPRNLLLLLNARAHSHPSTFAGADARRMAIGSFNEYIDAVNALCELRAFMVLLEHEDYGRIVSIDDPILPFDGLQREVQFLVPDGIRIIQLQKDILEFLISCCQQILHDIPHHLLTTGEIPVQVASGLNLKAQKNKGQFTSSLSLTVQESAFLVPADPDPSRIEALMGARLVSAEDHVWALREDPGYFKMKWREALDHDFGWQSYCLKQGANPRPRAPVYRPPEVRAELQARPLSLMMVSAYSELEVFSMLFEIAKQIRKLHEYYSPVISKLKDLPQALLDELVRFCDILLKAIGYITFSIKNLKIMSPPLRSFFLTKTPDGLRITQNYGSSVKEGSVEHRVLEELKSLNLPVSKNIPTLAAHLDELGRLIEDDPRASKLLSAPLAGRVGDLSIVLQCAEQVLSYYPWSRVFAHELWSQDRDLERGPDICGNRLELTRDMHRQLASHIVEKELQLCEASEKNFGYPTPKRPSRETTDMMRRAEKNLDTLWGHFDAVVKFEGEAWEGSPAVKLHQDQRPIYRTLEWIDVPPPDPAPQRPSSNASAEEKPLLQPLQNLYLDHDDGASTAESNIQEKKSKVKTRGQPSDETSNSAPPIQPEADLAIDDGPVREKIRVDASTLELFGKLFFVPNSRDSTGEVPWAQFVSAMTRPGLFSSEKLYGSVWQFTRDSSLGSDSGGTRIQFHEPHPSTKMSSQTARRIGRRLQRRFGWDIDTFVLEE